MGFLFRKKGMLGMHGWVRFSLLKKFLFSQYCYNENFYRGKKKRNQEMPPFLLQLLSKQDEVKSAQQETEGKYTDACHSPDAII